MSPHPVPPQQGRLSGDQSRDRIKAELRRRKAAGERPPTLEELAAAIDRGKTTVHHHRSWMEQNGVIRIEDARREIILLNDEDPAAGPDARDQDTGVRP